MPGFLQLYLHGRKEAAGKSGALPTLGEVERGYIEFLLDLTRRNKTETARILNISRRALYYKLAGYGPSGETALPSSDSAKTLSSR